MPPLWAVTIIMVESPRIEQFKSLKGQRKIVCLTAYSAPMTHALDPHCDLLLVGDSVAMVLYGMDTTQGADLDMMIRHGQAVMRRRQTAVVIIDLPAGSYENSPEQALATARRVLDETGSDGVKLEGGSQMAGYVARLVESDIAVLAHIGLLPQKATSKSSFRITGRTAEEAEQLASDAHAVCDAGAFGIVMEGIIEPVAASIAADCPVPTIGIGASPACDGQILVTEDILGLYDGFTPKFVEKFADLQTEIDAAATAFHEAVVSETFPLEQHLFWPKQ
jgi:3-methyl-2-oxobutanoate hydroxymethyltransferase